MNLLILLIIMKTELIMTENWFCKRCNKFNEYSELHCQNGCGFTKGNTDIKISSYKCFNCNKNFVYFYNNTYYITCISCNTKMTKKNIIY